MSSNHWVILIGGYGAFLFEGSEQEAEEMRAHKARWERGSGRKRLAEEDEIASGKVSECLNHPGFNNHGFFIDCDCDDMECVLKAQTREESRS